MRRPTPSTSFTTPWRAALFAACLLAQGAIAHAAPEGVSTGSCDVLASGQLRSGEYIAQYEGACKNGLADGNGKATWQSRYAQSAAPVVWQGKFTQGVYLADPQTLGTKRVDSTRVLLDTGPLDAPKGAKAGRLWVESRVEGKLPPSICQPLSLQVSANGDFASDDLAKGWMDKAYARWLSICKASGADALKGRQLRVLLHDGTGWSPDSYGNIPGGVAQASRPISATAEAAPHTWQSYSNRAAQQQASAQRDKQQAEQLQANEKRLRAFAHKHGATRYVELRALEKNPFRFGDSVILVAVRMHEARTPIEATVRSANGGRYDWSNVLLRGPIANWDEQGRIVAARVKGRSTDDGTRDAVILEIIDSQRCEASNCEDYLYMPGNRWLRDEALNAALHEPQILARGTR
ncbi:hypothetical protein [Diaphorobacter caeni]|uniref:hypothetical protein n=1 Tax=Diaphorobacter caeni TaxID=2784387 RepID=UPI00188FCBD2|nr:hypothetical protein [Diaphorobacter caeni]MBF5003091.1 hypothetical protein [Diaphorobacter caeni]